MSENAYKNALRTARDDGRCNREHDHTTSRRLMVTQNGGTFARTAPRLGYHVLEMRVMAIKNAADDVMAAVAVMQHARNACANLSPLGLPMTQAQLEHRARVISAVINASRKLQQLRDRAVSLEGALARFRARKAELAA
jgi:hypothetical protein